MVAASRDVGFPPHKEVFSVFLASERRIWSLIDIYLITQQEVEDTVTAIVLGGGLL